MRAYLETASRCELNYDSPPMRLWHKAKLLGVWDPEGFNLRPDTRDWQRLSDLERELLLHLSALFLSGEEAVVRDLLPLIRAISSERRLEEEIYLTSFLWEEAKHVEAFSRFLTEVACARTADLSRFHGPAYRQLFYRELPDALKQLEHDPSPETLASASVTYNMIVEGVMAESGYYAYHRILCEHDLMPGMQQIVYHVKKDEARHIAYGVFLLSRLVAEYGAPVWQTIESRMGQLLSVALDVIYETLSCYEHLPFGLAVDDFIKYATEQFQRRMQRIARAREQSLNNVLQEFAFDPAEV